MPRTSAKLISDLYQRALAVPEPERAAFLDRECSGEAALREEVASLLRFEPASERFLETPAVVVNAAPATGVWMIGRRLGSYTLTAPLGAGGMGEVYRARDSKLGRDVAVKILPPHFTDDPERRARFAREARVLATLNHPHIGAIYGLEESDGVTGLVLELVEGETLAERLERGSLPTPEALAIARQIGEALAAAHEKGIVHRDLKPGNVVLQSVAAAGEVRAKVLDFGLAKPMAGSGDSDLARHRPDSFDGSTEGRILGTPAYMSPEQARGLAVDKRTDIWAFGCVLFEMLTGARPFEGATVTDTLARVLEREPDWSRLPADVPAPVRLVLDRCLRKDARKRLHDIADATIELDHENLVEAPQTPPVSARTSAPKRKRLAWLLAAFAGGAVVASVLFGTLPSDTDPPVQSLDIPLGGVPGADLAAPFEPFALSPDGRHMVLVVRNEQRTRLWLRELASSRLRELPDTDSASFPFWSPDSRRIGFITRGKLKTIALDGTTATTLCSVPQGSSSRLAPTWSTRGSIVFQSASGHLLKVPEKAGDPVPATRLEKGHVAHVGPSFLPDGEHFLFFASGANEGELRVGSLSTTESAALGPIVSAPLYASGHLLFSDRFSLMVQRFDAESLRRVGEPYPLLTRVVPAPRSLAFSVSDTGLLVYREPSSIASQLTWLDRSGRPVATVGDPGNFANLALNRDENQLAVSKVSVVEGDAKSDIWVLDLTRKDDNGIRLTTHPALEFDPGWSYDSKSVVFNSNRQKEGYYSLFRRAADRTGEDDLVAQLPQGSLTAADYSPDGLFLIAQGRGRLWLIENRPGATPKPFMKLEDGQWQASFSPDGKWVVYVSDKNKTAQFEVFATPFPSADREVKISVQGGYHPRWRADNEIVFLSPDSAMMSVRVRRGADLKPDPPVPLFPTSLSLRNNRGYDVTRDGLRFMIPVPAAGASRDALRLVTNWTARLPQ
jgi:serine/threonine protein kinase/Tol biopolymer transport system component